MVIIRTRAIEVSIQAVSPELGEHFVRTAGTAATAAYLSVASTAETATAQEGIAGGAGLAAGAAAAGAAAAGAAAGASSAREAPGLAKPMNAAIAKAGARPASILVSFIFELRSLEWFLVSSERVSVFFAGANAHRLLERVDENLAVADLTGARRGRDGLDHLIDHVGVDRDFDFQLRQKAHGVFGAAINLGVPLLAPVAFDFRHRQSVHPDGSQRVAHLLQFERLNHCHHYFHVPHPSLAAVRPNPGASS